MKRTLLAATLAATLAQAAVAHGQGAEPPPGQRSIISVRVGSTFVESPCHLSVRRTFIASGRPSQDGQPAPAWDVPFPGGPTSRDGCRGLDPVVLRRARHMTVTLLGQSPQVGATWFRGGRPTPLTVRPVGEPPTAVWFLRLPLTSGKLVLHMWYPVTAYADGAVVQDRSDFKLAIRRKLPPAPSPETVPPPVAEPVVPIDGTTFADSGRR